MKKDRPDEEKLTYLEMKYDTDVKNGLLSEEAVRRARREKKQNTNEERKRMFFTFLIREWKEPLFLFLCFEGTCLLIFQIKGAEFVAFSLLFLFLITIKRAVRYEKTEEKRRQILLADTYVLRDGLYKKTTVENLVPGDIVRMKNGRVTPTEIVSLSAPFQKYSHNMIYRGNTGKALVTQILPENLCREKWKPLSDRRKSVLQEIFIRNKIMLMPSFFEKGEDKTVPEISVIAFSEDFFPGTPKNSRTREFFEQLNKREIRYFCFTGLSVKQAEEIGKKAGIITKDREVISAQQFRLLKGENLKKQFSGIRIYCGLSMEEKERVLSTWKETGEKIFYLSRKEGREEDSQIYDMTLLDQKRKADVYFLGMWRENLQILIRGLTRWKAYFSFMEKAEKRTEEIFCILLTSLLILCMISPGRMNGGLVLELAGIGSSCLILLKEMMEEVFRIRNNT
ncbi:MAG: hypothetical protein MR867_00250 [Eubacterium sp.]|nr:hypothetical protein [Eubacterium sp.]MDY5497406.1 hypothetical protein [Anaerobutyricum sp.]